MIYLPSLRRLLLPALIALAIIAIYRTSSQSSTTLPPLRLHQKYPSRPRIHVPVADLRQQRFPIVNTSDYHFTPLTEGFHAHKRPYQNGSRLDGPDRSQPAHYPHLQDLFKCPMKPNRFTNHIRLPYLVRNISMVPLERPEKDTRTFWNPTIISLPYWSTTQYLLVSRILTDGRHQQNVFCEADICHSNSTTKHREGEMPCSKEDTVMLGHAGGLRCVTKPVTLDVPPTPAEKCDGKYGSFAEIPGFHDPRVFWSGRGEPLMMVNTQ